MIYEYTTYALERHVVLTFLVIGLITVLITSIALILFAEETVNGIVVHHEKKIASLAAFIFAIGVTLSYRPPYENEKVTATLVDISESTYKNGKSSYVKGATVTYKLPDGGLVTFRADNGTAWYPEIILYKNLER